MRDTRREVSVKYCPRFGHIALEMGLIDGEQLKKALCEQIDDEVSGRARRLLGEIMNDLGYLTSGQIDQVLERLFRELREEG